MSDAPSPDLPLSPVAAALATVTSTLPDGGEARPGQVMMAEAVEEALVEHRHLIVQAGTGTGKSLAYLVPAVQLGRPVVIATATKALQEQLARRDAPQVANALGDVTVAVLKGRSNYLCRQRAAELSERGFQATLEDAGEEESSGRHADRLVAQVERLLAFEKSSATGDRAGLDEDVSERAWSMVSVGPRECPGAFNCPQGSRCFAEMARVAAQEADVVIVNLHLLGSHLASDGMVLPEHDAVIIDEAHELEEVMTQTLGVEVSAGRLRSLATLARSLGDPSSSDDAAELAACADGLAEVLGALDEQVLVELDVETDVAIQLGRCDDALRSLMTSLRGIAGDGADARAVRALSTATRLLEELARVTVPGSGEVLWCGGTRSNRTLTLSPIDVGPALLDGLFDRCTVVMTSATIPPGLAQRLRLGDGEVSQIDVGSPFDFQRQSILYVPTHLADRRNEQAEVQIADEIASLLQAAGGRTLALFTSRRALNEIADRVADRVDHPILVQGMASNQALIERFRAEEDACLFATMGMWQGLDVPGRSLSLVTIDRLPFGRPDDPVLEARRERAGSQAFRLVDLPRAATLLAQGVGRLIRSKSDEGIVAVLDPRLATASYRSVLLEALPPMKRSVSHDEAIAFLTAIRERAENEAAALS